MWKTHFQCLHEHYTVVGMVGVLKWTSREILTNTNSWDWGRCCSAARCVRCVHLNNTAKLKPFHCTYISACLKRQSTDWGILEEGRLEDWQDHIDEHFDWVVKGHLKLYLHLAATMGTFWRLSIGNRWVSTPDYLEEKSCIKSSRRCKSLLSSTCNRWPRLQQRTKPPKMPSRNLTNVLSRIANYYWSSNAPYEVQTAPRDSRAAGRRPRGIN